MPVEVVVTTKWFTVLRRDGMRCWWHVVQLVARPRDRAVGDAHKVVRRVDGVLPGVHETRRSRLSPSTPRPPPLTPRAVGWVTLASARVKVSPSAPEPEPM